MIRMKKILVLLFTIVSILSLVGCGNNRENMNTEDKQISLEDGENGNTTISSDYESFEDKEIGDIVEFGNYNGNTEWIVLDKYDGKLFLLSKYVIESRKYNKKKTGITWETSSLRRWLNDDYINCAFNEHERKALMETHIITEDYDEETIYGSHRYTDGGNPTDDKVFLLSDSEVGEYLSGSDRVATTNTGMPAAWWLRNPGFGCFRYVYYDGSYMYADMNIDDWDIDDGVEYLSGGVRPAMWIDISVADEALVKSEESSVENDSTDVEYSLESIPESNIGDIVKFGNYNGNTEWIVLDKRDGKVFLLSLYPVESMPYNAEPDTDAGAYGWEDSTLRGWLNGEYFETSFNEEEKMYISDTRLITKETSKKGYGDAICTMDKVFLLSEDEAYKYLPHKEDRKLTDSNGRSVWWWLRSESRYRQVLNVCNDGNFDYQGKDVTTNEGQSVRPAMWLDFSIQEVDKKENEKVVEDLYRLADKEKGDVIKFGNYDCLDEWIVLDKKDGKLLIISKYVIEGRQFDSELGTTWEECELREWLNGEYIDYTFNEYEKSIISKSFVKNGYNSYGIYGGKNTEDQVFLLSEEEANKYFPTKKAKFATIISGMQFSWLLRSVGRADNLIMFVAGYNTDDVIQMTRTVMWKGVRPAMWIEPSKVKDYLQ